nr:AsmA-like C-terminal region-containing protein [uncultured Tolumonas sp.]
MKPNIAGVDIYALLKQFAGFEKIEGRATVGGSLAMQGGDTSALKNSLTGNLTSRITDGAWRGINIAKTIREAKAALSGLKGGEQTVATSNVEKTDFTELTASILFNQGVASNKDLTMKSPLLRINGEGEVNLKADDINYLLKAALVNTSKGQEGADRDKLHGVTVPIRIKGSTSAPKYSLDLTAALKENAGAKLEEKKQEVQQKLEQKAGDALSKGLKKLF